MVTEYCGIGPEGQRTKLLGRKTQDHVRKEIKAIRRQPEVGKYICGSCTKLQLKTKDPGHIATWSTISNITDK